MSKLPLVKDTYNLNGPPYKFHAWVKKEERQYGNGLVDQVLFAIVEDEKGFLHQFRWDSICFVKTKVIK